MSPLQFVILFVAAGALAVRFLGGLICRVAGWSFMTGGAVALASEPGFGAVGVLALGCALWLVGHLHYALRHGAHKSALAGRVLRGRRGAGARPLGSPRSAVGDHRRRAQRSADQRRPIPRTGKVS
jgi:hypothetical protein